MKKTMFAAIAALVLLAACGQLPFRTGEPRFAVDPYWPKPLPGNWILGQVAGIAVDRNDHVWIIHRPGTLVDDEKGAAQSPPQTRCCTPAPAVLEFDAAGQSLPQLGRAGEGLRLAGDRARHLCRRVGQRLDRRQRQQGPPDPEIHARREIPRAVRQGGQQRRLEQQHPARPPRAPGDRRAGERAVHRRRLPEPPRAGARRLELRLQAPLGRLRQQAVRREAARVRPREAVIAAVRQPGALRAPVARRAGVRLRPRQRPHPGFREGAAASSRNSASSRRPCRTARCGTSCSRRTARRSTCSWPTAPTARCWSSSAKPAR